VTPSTDILGDPAHAAHLKQQHPLHAALMTQSSKDPPPVSIVDPFNARLAVQVGAKSVSTNLQPPWYAFGAHTTQEAKE